ncbi:MAG: hypothetical protein HWN66_20565 [Candidatus Helarchaeota archaeon]|nr:hypothetical protein [Candidatus Helarchaeota archaeon]
MKKWVKGLLIIGIITSGTFSLLLAPIVPVFLTEYRVIPNDIGINQINLIVNTDTSNIQIDYASSNDSDLIELTCGYTVRHSVLVPPSNLPINFQKYNNSGILTVIATIDVQGIQYGTIVSSSTLITINPRLISNLTIASHSGNIDLITTNFQNLTFQDVNLTTLHGNCFTTFIPGCIIQGNLSILTSSGNNRLIVSPNCEIEGQLIANTTTGNNEVTFGENCTIGNDFFVQTTTGTCIFTVTNCSLNNKNITGILESSSGAINSTITQWVNPNGNLTLDVDSVSGNCRLIMDYSNSSFASTIYYTTGTGNIFYDGFVGFNAILGGNRSKNWPLSSIVNVTIDTNSGNIYLQGGFS